MPIDCQEARHCKRRATKLLFCHLSAHLDAYGHVPEPIMNHVTQKHDRLPHALAKTHQSATNLLSLRNDILPGQKPVSIIAYSIGRNHRGPQSLGHLDRKVRAMTTGSAKPLSLTISSTIPASTISIASSTASIPSACWEAGLESNYACSG